MRRDMLSSNMQSRTALRWPGITLLLLLSVVGLACTATQKRPVVATAMTNDETRHESFEAMLHVLDAHPEYVDEMFSMTLQHPATLGRLLHDSAQQMHDEALAHQAANELAAAPASLKTTLLASLSELPNQPAAMDAAAEALGERSTQAAKIMVQRELTVRRTVHALTEELQRNPKAKHAFLLALRENSEPMAAVITSEPEVMAALFRAVGKLGVQRGSSEFQAFLRTLKE